MSLRADRLGGLRRRTGTFCFLVLLGAAGSLAAAPRVLQVGPGKTYAVPSAAAAVAQDGDTVEIAAGTYTGDVCAWRAKNLTIRGAGRDKTILDAAGKCCQGKGTWIVKGEGCRVSGLTFKGAACADRNGAGIRLEGNGVFVVEKCRFTENENGILCGALDRAVVKIDGCVFDANGAGDGCSHNLYIGKIAELDFTRCVSHHARLGHNLKSRAKITRVVDSTFDDGKDGTSSYLLNCPNGGEVTLTGCRFVQAPTASNGTMVSIGEEGAYPDSTVDVRKCTFVNRRTSGTCTEIRCAPGVRRLDSTRTR